MKPKFTMIIRDAQASVRLGMSWIAQPWSLSNKRRRAGLIQLPSPERPTFRDKWGGIRLCVEVMPDAKVR